MLIYRKGGNKRCDCCKSVYHDCNKAEKTSIFYLRWKVNNLCDYCKQRGVYDEIKE